MNTRLRRAKAILHSIKCRHLISSAIFIICYLTCVFILRRWLTWDINSFNVEPQHPWKHREKVKNDASLSQMHAEVTQSLNEPDLGVVQKSRQDNQDLFAKDINSEKEGNEEIQSDGSKSLARHQNINLLNEINSSYSQRESNEIGKEAESNFEIFQHSTNKMKNELKDYNQTTTETTVQTTTQSLTTKINSVNSNTGLAGQTGISASKSRKMIKTASEKNTVEIVNQTQHKDTVIKQSLPKVELLPWNHKVVHPTAAQASLDMTKSVKSGSHVQLSVPSIPNDLQTSEINFLSNEIVLTRSTKGNQQQGQVPTTQKMNNRILNVSSDMPAQRKVSVATATPVHARDAKQKVNKVASQILETKEQFSSKENKTNSLGNQLKEDQNESLVIEADPLCRIPILDPFDDAIRNAITQVNTSQRCPTKIHKFGKTSGGMLHVNGKNILHASVYFPRRSRGHYPDFYLDDATTTTLILTNRNTKPLTKGEQGCLATGSKLVTLVNDPGIYLSSQWKCTGDILFQWTGSRKLRHTRSGKCLTTPETTSRRQLVVLGSCSDEPDIIHLRFRSDGTMLSGCLMVDSYNQLSYSSACNGSIKMTMSFYVAQDLNTSVPMSEDGAHLHIITTAGESNELFLHASPRGESEIVKDSKQDQSLPNIVMIILEAQSAANAERSLSETLKELRTHPMSVFMKGHTINGDGTTAQLCAMLTGKQEHELPEARRGKEGAKEVDLWPFVFKNYRERGYITAFSEDDPDYGAFNYRLFGFNDPPTDHYPRPFWQHARKKEFLTNPESCILNSFSHQYSLDYISSLYDAYPSRPKFVMSVTARLSHDHPEYITLADSDIAKWLRDMRVKNRLNNTLVMIAGDHGPRIGSFRATLQGKLEERLPFLSLSLPLNWKEKHVDLLSVLEANSQGLTTHFDIHSTLLDIIHSFNASLSSTRGQSLFRRIDPSLRTCSNAGIDEHWCPCLNYETLSTSDLMVQKLALSVVEHINNLTKVNRDGRKLCAPLKLQNITRASKKMPNQKVQKFLNTVASEDCDSCQIELAQDSVHSNDPLIYEIAFSVVPSGGTYEATVRVHDEKIYVDENISRTNKYGDQPWCIQNKFPGLRKFCFCTKQKENSRVLT